MNEISEAPVRIELLSRAERRLHQSVARLLPTGETVEGAAVVFTGPRGGIEGFLASFLGLLRWLVINRRRHFFTVALTSHGVALMRNVRMSKPVEVLWRRDGYESFGPVNDAVGDFSIELAGQRYWYVGQWSFEVYRMRQLAAAPPRSAPPNGGL
jgi:hypothetical protein